jgi:hypothetical protein
MKKSERDERKAKAIQDLRDILPPGSTVYLTLSRVSRSGMSRVIKCIAKTEHEGDAGKWEDMQDISWHIAHALEYPLVREEGVRIGGCGMDMGLALIDNLSYAVYGKPSPQKRYGGGGEGINYKWL